MPSSILDEERIPTSTRIFCGLVGISISIASVHVIFLPDGSRAGLFLAVFGWTCLYMACQGSYGNIECVEKSAETCPKCGTKGSIEIYKQKTEETHADFTVIAVNTTVTTKTAMVNCTNPICSYRSELEPHMKENLRKERRLALTDAYNREAAAESMEGQGIVLGSEDSSVFANTKTTEERVSLTLSRLEEEECREELRQKRRDKSGTLLVHPESARLKAECGSCPGCSGPAMFARWQRDIYPGMISSLFNRPIVLERVDMAQCYGGGCGYIARLDEHKKRVRHEAV